MEALRNVDLTIRPGEITAILGPNGAGKTTALSLILGLRRPSAGTVRLLGLPTEHPHARRRVGAMLQESGVPPMLTVAELVELFSSYYPHPRRAAEGAVRRFVGPMPMDDLNVMVDRIADELRAEGRKPYPIPVGGSSPLGASAYANAAEEILTQLGHDDVLLITATGSGGTQAGLAARLGHERVLGIDVGAVDDPLTAVRRLTIAVAERVDLPTPRGEPRIRRDQIGDGYGAPTNACLGAIRLAARTEGLLLDPVYSGKAMAGLIGLPRSELEARAVVFLATGGVPALFESRYEAWLSGLQPDLRTG